ncbi:hypothetical protein BJV82DRAFT_632871 [Fennellomyces sp. T-0311]|nr:hypothetical protein BJV82DRAFT_632871 [Fennellomyces sp. T-0311]
MNHGLDQSLELLNNRLLHARAQLRQARRKADTKRQLLLNSGNVLEYELQDAFSTETMPRKQKPRILPPAGLVPLINAPGTENDDVTTAADNDKECFLIHSCTACIRGPAEDRVWLRLVVENTSSVTISQAHIVLHPPHLLAQQLARNTQYAIAPGLTVELYAAFTVPNDIFHSQLVARLSVACHYATVGNQFSNTDYCQVHWNLGIDWIQTPAIPDQALSIFYPSHARGRTSSQDYDRISNLLNMHRAKNTDYFYTDSEDLVIAAADRCLNIYGLTDRTVALCVTSLLDAGVLESIKYGPPAPVSANDFMASLQNEVGYVAMDTNSAQETGPSVLAARETTTALLGALLQTRGNH